MSKTPHFFFILIITSLIGVNGFSQTVYGLQGGINISTLAGPKDYNENKLKFGATIYAYTDFSLGRNSMLSIETGLGLSQQGMRHVQIVEDIASKTVTKVTNKLNYVFVPVYLRENMTNFYTKIGPYGAYLLGAKSKNESETLRSFKVLSDSTFYNEDFVNNLRTYDLGLSFGAGYIHFFQPGPRRHRGRGRSKLTPVVAIDFRYNIGFFKIGTTGEVSNMNVRNQTFTVGVSITSVRN